jgi:hypothetical protein
MIMMMIVVVVIVVVVVVMMIRLGVRGGVVVVVMIVMVKNDTHDDGDMGDDGVEVPLWYCGRPYLQGELHRYFPLSRFCKDTVYTCTDTIYASSSRILTHTEIKPPSDTVLARGV